MRIKESCETAMRMNPTHFGLEMAWAAGRPAGEPINRLFAGPLLIFEVP